MWGDAKSLPTAQAGFSTAWKNPDLCMDPAHGPRYPSAVPKDPLWWDILQQILKAFLLCSPLQIVVLAMHIQLIPWEPLWSITRIGVCFSLEMHVVPWSCSRRPQFTWQTLDLRVVLTVLCDPLPGSAVPLKRSLPQCGKENFLLFVYRPACTQHIWAILFSSASRLPQGWVVCLCSFHSVSTYFQPCFPVELTLLHSLLLLGCGEEQNRNQESTELCLEILCPAKLCLPEAPAVCLIQCWSQRQKYLGQSVELPGGPLLQQTNVWFTLWQYSASFGTWQPFVPYL